MTLSKRKADKPNPAKPKPQIPAGPETETPRLWVLVLPVMVLAFVCFLPALRADFVIWDDDYNLIDNPKYRGLGWEQLGWMWTTYHAGHYHPLTWMTFGLDYTLWGMNPRGYHLTNMILHGLNAGLFYLVAYGLMAAGGIRSRWGAAVAALFFGMHPLRAESVAWATERRDVLSGFFYLLSVLAYLRMAEVKGRRRYALWLGLSLGACGLSLLSKAWAITIPAVLLVLDLYPLRRIKGNVRQILAEKALFGMLAVPFLVWAGKAQETAGAALSLEQVSVGGRLTTAAYGLFFYIWKTVMPWGLAALYQMSNPFSPWEMRFFFSGAFVVAAGALVIWNRKRWPWLAAAAAAYVVVVSPVLGLFQSGDQLAADRYSYLACLSWAVLIGAGVTQVARRSGRRVMTTAACAAVLAVLGGLTWKQTRVWKDTISLWEHAIRVDPKCWTAYNNLGLELNRRDKLDQAIECFEKALRLQPTYIPARSNLAVTLVKQQHWAAAVEQFKRVIPYQSEHAGLRASYAAALRGMGNLPDAIVQYRQAVAWDPSLTEARYNLAVTLLDAGRRDDAIATLRELLAVDPDYVLALRKLGVLLLNTKSWAEAVKVHRRLVAGDAVLWVDHFNLGVGLLELGQTEQATAAFDDAIRMDDKRPAASFQVGLLWARKGQYARAVAVFRAALNKQPENPDIGNSLAWILATCPQDDLRDGAEAVRLAEAAHKVVGHDTPNMLDTLAAAYAEAGRFDQAVKTARKGLDAARAAKMKSLAAGLEKRLALYRRRKPYHAKPPRQ